MLFTYESVIKLSEYQGLLYVNHHPSESKAVPPPPLSSLHPVLPSLPDLKILHSQCLFTCQPPQECPSGEHIE